MIGHTGHTHTRTHTLYMTLATTDRLASLGRGQRDSSSNGAGQNSKLKNPLRKEFMFLSLGRHCQRVCRSMAATCEHLMPPLGQSDPPTQSEAIAGN